MTRRHLLIVLFVSLFGGILIPILHAADAEAAGTRACLPTVMGDETVPTSALGVRQHSDSGPPDGTESEVVYARYSLGCTIYTVRYTIELKYCKSERVENPDGAGSSIKRTCWTVPGYVIETRRRCAGPTP